MKTLKDLNGMVLLGKNEQARILGGKMMCVFHTDAPPSCPPGFICIGSTCELLPPVIE